MPESAREFKKTFKPTMLEMNSWWTSRSDEDDEWAKVYMLEFAEAYASSRVAALEQRIAELEDHVSLLARAVLSGDLVSNHSMDESLWDERATAALARLREVKE